MFRMSLPIAAAMAGGMALFSVPAAACTSYQYTGTLCTVPFDWCPEGFAMADGQSLPIQQYQPLYALLGTRYGGDGKTSFNLPDLRGRAVIGAGTGIGLIRTPLGQALGQQAVTLTQDQVPLKSHNHSASFAGTGAQGGTGTIVPFTGTVSVPITNGGNPVSAPTSGTVYLSTTSIDDGGSGATIKGPYNTNAPSTSTGAKVTGTTNGTINVPFTGFTGGNVSVAAAGALASKSVPTQPPSLALNVCIALKGEWPDRQ
ncbi:hypothetical protein TSH58p_06995 [Azospirillum sp. TSH58]|uniref:phage tail protein n=2 Tax=Azospirillum sp. TSH58 TaxID=664962 RepID=UPI000D5FF3D1|nr:tail fiber protein [Azospirillum sp. TSH58]AWJ83296.1 hypothetical protein TSH58p_06995 [Azospirillum sp. TSH58]PWC80270.1 hypothetical protein TSH58_02730 [Azospirillum sp. TSH58]